MAFKVKSTEYYLSIANPPPCQYCESCSIAIKEGTKRCPYLDQPFWIKASHNRVEELKTSPHCFVDFPYLYLINSTFQRMDTDDDIWDICIK